MICSKCEDSLLIEDALLCVSCKKEFHYFCCGQSEKNYKAMNKSKYKCHNCKDKNSPDGKLLTCLSSGSLNAIAGDMTYWDAKFKRIEEAMNKKGDVIINTLGERIKQLENKLKEKDKKVKELEERIDMLENRSRSCNIEIGNFPEQKGEEVKKIVMKIGKTIGMNIREGEVQIAHRVNSKNRSVRPIVAMLGSRLIRNQWLSKYKEYRQNHQGVLKACEIGKEFKDSAVYLQEHITVQKKLLLKEIKTAAKNNNYKFVWVKDANILMKKNEKESKIFKFASASEWDAFATNEPFY